MSAGYQWGDGQRRLVAAREGESIACLLPDGRRACVRPLMHGYALLSVQWSDWLRGRVYDATWMYHNADVAALALGIWAGAGGDEPPGWNRHPASGRRRPFGIPDFEYVEDDGTIELPDGSLIQPVRSPR